MAEEILMFSDTELFTSLVPDEGVLLFITRHLIRLPYVDGSRVAVYGKVTLPESD